MSGRAVPDRRPSGPIDFGWVAWRVALGVALILSATWIVPFYLEPGHIFVDAHIYFQATAAWLDGGNPWTATYSGIPFAGIPPTLILNVPLLPFGESVAVAIWAVTNTVSVGYLIRRLRLPIWTILMLPMLEGWLAATPDLTLAALVVAGAGWIAALTKPYSVPAMLAEGRGRQVAAAALIGAVSVPLLPWQTFYLSRDIVAATFEKFAGHPVSASGSPIMLVAVAIALALLRWRRGLALATPGLLAQQPHYLVFSLSTIMRSRILILGATLPFQHAAAIGVVLYALHEAARGLARRDATPGTPVAGPLS